MEKEAAGGSRLGPGALTTHFTDWPLLSTVLPFEWSRGTPVHGPMLWSTLAVVSVSIVSGVCGLKRIFLPGSRPLLLSHLKVLGPQDSCQWC